MFPLAANKEGITVSKDQVVVFWVKLRFPLPVSCRLQSLDARLHLRRLKVTRQMTNVEARDSDSDIIQPTDMNSLNPTGRALRGVPTVFKRVRQSNSLSNGSHIAHRFSRCLSYSPSSRAPGTTGEPPKTPLDPVTLHRLEAERRAYYKRRSYYSGAGFVAGMIAIWLIATSIDLPPKPTKLDSPSSISKKRDDTLNAVGKTAVLQKLGKSLRRMMM